MKLPVYVGRSKGSCVEIFLKENGVKHGSLSKKHCRSPDVGPRGIIGIITFRRPTFKCLCVCESVCVIVIFFSSADWALITGCRR